MDVHIEPARPERLPALQTIEREAGRRFAGLGLVDHLLDETLSLDELAAHQAAGRVWVLVADGQPIGFAVADVVDGTAHLEELDVLPAFGRQGHGRRLVEHVCRWAEGHGFPALTLSTFGDVPWNGPLYARWGFRVLGPDEIGPGLLQLRQHERADGIPVEARVFMRRELRPRPLVLYDGDCGVCSHVVRWLLRADRERRLAFAPLAGETAAAVRARHPEMPPDLDSLVYVERTPGGERVSWESDGMFRLWHDLGGAWRVLSRLRALPRPLTDAAYRAFARNRHRVSADVGACALPPPAGEPRFLP
jgi:predicted DCC family thiol-disulfide oxidoreductase YuxK/GNAT superfamily N-acetyltransferase